MATSILTPAVLTIPATYAVRTVTASGSLLSTDDFVLAVPSSANITLTLPDASTNVGNHITIKRNSAAYLVYVAPASGTIDGSASYTLSANYQSVTVICDGSNWFIM